MFGKKTIENVRLTKGLRVIVRADFNVPINERGVVTDDYRLRRTLPTINHLLEKNCRIVLISHLGRPEGRYDPSLSMAPVAVKLSELLGREVAFVDDIVGEKARNTAQALAPGQMLMLDNLRFNPGEETNDAEFAARLAEMGQLFVMDAFGAAHRAHASTEGITHHIRSVAGFLLRDEVDSVGRAISDPKRPLLAILGGAKVTDKIDVIRKLIELADAVALGGAMANTFLKADGMDVGHSITEDEALDSAREILAQARQKAQECPFVFYLPQDGVTATSTDQRASARIVDWASQTVADILNYPKTPPQTAYQLGPEEMILDIGPFSAGVITGLIAQSATVIWNGTLGMTEARPLVGARGPFEHGSYAVLTALGKRQAPFGQFSFVGGGDTASYVVSAGGEGYPDFISTGGGASLELLVGNRLPGVEALEDA